MAGPNGPITVCVINLKDGVGKSIIFALLAHGALGNRQKDVRAIDLDPQANLSQALMSHDYNNFLTQRRPSIVELFNGYQPPATGRASASALPADAGVETITRWTDRSLQLIPSRSDFKRLFPDASTLSPVP